MRMCLYVHGLCAWNYAALLVLHRWDMGSRGVCSETSTLIIQWSFLSPSASYLSFPQSQNEGFQKIGVLIKALLRSRRKGSRKIGVSIEASWNPVGVPRLRRCCDPLLWHCQPANRESASSESLSLSFWEAPSGPRIFTPLKSTACLSQTLWNPDSWLVSWPHPFVSVQASLRQEVLSAYSDRQQAPSPPSHEDSTRAAAPVPSASGQAL